MVWDLTRTKYAEKLHTTGQKKATQKIDRQPLRERELKKLSIHLAHHQHVTTSVTCKILDGEVFPTPTSH
jgi:hypothetical protein